MDPKLTLLSYKIEVLRSKLNKLVNSRDLLDTKVIKYSCMLDELLTEYLTTSLSQNKAA